MDFDCGRRVRESPGFDEDNTDSKEVLRLRVLRENLERSRWFEETIIESKQK